MKTMPIYRNFPLEGLGKNPCSTNSPSHNEQKLELKEKGLFNIKFQIENSRIVPQTTIIKMELNDTNMAEIDDRRSTSLFVLNSIFPYKLQFFEFKIPIEPIFQTFRK